MTGWLQSTSDRAREEARIDVRALQSPSGLATAIFRRSGVAPLLAKYQAPSDFSLDRWMSAHFGGWQTGEQAEAGVFRAVDIDQVAAYANNFGLIGGWEYCTAAELAEVDALDHVRDIAARMAAGEIDLLFDRSLYSPLSLGCTIVETTGGELPVEVDEPGHPVGGFRIRAVISDLPLSRSVYDVLLSALRTGSAEGIVSATRLRPEGRQPGLRRHLPLYDGVVIDLDQDDPVAALVRLRRKAKASGDERLAGLVRVVVNAMSYGNFARLDQFRARVGRSWVETERPAEYTFPPIAVSVTSLTRLLVGAAEQLLCRESR